MNPESMHMYADRITDPNTRVKAGVGIIIIDNEGKIVLERRRDNGMWGLPGGRIEPGESVLETAVREAKEETGLHVRITGLVGVYSDPSDGRIVTYPDNGDVAHLVDTVLKVEIVSGELTVSSESIDLRFFAPDSLPSDIVLPALQPLQDYLEGKESIIR